MEITALTRQTHPTLLSRAAIKVLLTPIGHADRAVMREFGPLFHAIDSFPISLLDFPKSSTVTSHAHRNAWIQLRFVDTISDEDLDNEFHANEQPHGVIGIMHCPSSPDLATAYSAQMKPLLEKMPSVCHHKCFAFEPPESMDSHNVPSDIIVIPNQKSSHLLLYLNTFLASFVVDLTQNLTGRLSSIERRQIIAAPSRHGQLLLSPTAGGGNGDEVSPTSATGYNYSASSLQNLSNLKSASSIKALDSGNGESRVSDSPVTTVLRATEPPPPILKAEMISGSYEANSQPRPNSADSSMASLQNMNSMNDTLRDRKRTPGRVQKLLADVFLMCGCWNRAIQCYESALDTARTFNDYLFQASAMEGLQCVNILLILAEMSQDDADEKASEKFVRFVAELKMRVDDISVVYDRSEYLLVKNRYLIYAATFATNLCLLLSPTPSSHKDILTSPVYAIIGENMDLAESLVQKREISLKTKLDNFTRKEVSQFIMKLWDGGLERLLAPEQMFVTSEMSRMFSLLGFKRKSAFFLRQTAIIMSMFLRSMQKEVFDGDEVKMTEDVVRLGRHLIHLQVSVCDLYDSRAFMPPLPVLKVRGKYSWLSIVPDGWPSIKMLALKDAVRASDSVCEFHYVSFFLVLQMRLSYSFPENDKLMFPDINAKIYQSLLQASSKLTHHRQLAMKFTKVPPIISSGEAVDKIEYFNAFSCLPVLIEIKLKISSHQQLPSPFVIPKSKAAASVAALTPGDPFIYNPFDKNSKKDIAAAVVAVQGEYLSIDLEIVNPYEFDISVEHISLVASADFKLDAICQASFPFYLSACSKFAPGTNTKTVHFLIRSKSVDSYGIVGAILQFGKGWFEFFPFGQTQPNNIDLPPDIFKAPESLMIAKAFEIPVIDKMPILKVRETNLTRNHCWMVLEGETNEISVSVENVGHADITHFQVITEVEFDKLEHVREKPTSLYEEHFLSAQTLVWIPGNEDTQPLPISKQRRVFINARGDLHCIGGRVDIIYGISLMVKGVEGVYCRKTSIPIDITVNPALIIDHLNFLPFDAYRQEEIRNSRLNSPAISATSPLIISPITNDNVASLRQSSSVEELFLMSGVDGLDTETISNDYCLFVADIRNQSSHPFHVQFDIFNDIDESTAESHEMLDPRTHPLTSNPALANTYRTPPITIYTHQTKRIVFPLKRLALDGFFEAVTANSHLNGDFLIPIIEHDPIHFVPPLPVPKSKQFFSKTGQVKYSSVVNTIVKAVKKFENSGDIKAATECWWDMRHLRNTLTGELLAACSEEKESRLAFWFRDQFFRRRIAGASWISAASADEPGRSCPCGILSLRSYPFSQEMVYALRKSAVEIRVEVRGDGIQRLGRSHWLISAETEAICMIELCVTIVASGTQAAVARLQAFQDSSEFDGRVIYDLSDKLVLCGSMQHLFTNKSNERWSVPVLVQSTGRYKMLIHSQVIEKPWEKKPLAEVIDNADLWKWIDEPLIIDVVKTSP